jgi:hypothetical protein
MKLTELCELGLKYGADKSPAVIHMYTPFYYEYFKDRRNEIKKVFEMGIGDRSQSRMVNRLGLNFVMGPSLRMWRDFFPNAVVHGADIDRRSLFTDNRIKTYYCNEAKDDEVINLINEIGSDIDVVIDDGNHRPHHQIHLCQTLMPLLKKEVDYFIEDSRNVGQVCVALSNFNCTPVKLPENERYPGGDRLILVKNK